MSEDYTPKPTKSENTNGQTLTTAELLWDENGQPLSESFDDVYFSRASGLDETRYVFLQHNKLAERWQQLQTSGSPVFTIAETGFGTGLNFLCAWQLWLQTAPSNARLHFISVEKYPLNKPDLEKALALWPELREESQQLQQAYPPAISGIHRRHFLNGRIQLTLIYGDATDYAELLPSPEPQWDGEKIETAKVDAWFLDGFAPSKNPQMWSPELFSAISRLSTPNTTAATFTCAGIVKRGLKSAGFTLNKVPGFGRKREMLTAVMPASDISNEEALSTDTTSAVTETNHIHADTASVSRKLTRKVIRKTTETPWYIPSKQQPPMTQRAIVVGGGIAGCTIAHSLATRGWQVTLLEQNERLAQDGSGNPQGLLYAKLSHKDSDQSQFNLQSLLYAQQFYTPFWQENTKDGQQCGVAQLAHSDEHENLQKQIVDVLTANSSPNNRDWLQYQTAETLSEIAGIPVSHGGLWFPYCGWLRPAAVCDWLCAHPNIQIQTHTRVSNIKQVETSPAPTQEMTQWQVHLESQTGTPDAQTLEAPVLILANALAAKQFVPWIPVKPIRGQVSYLPADDQSEALRCALCSEGYIAPAQDTVSSQKTAHHCIGASFHPNNSDTSTTLEDHSHNLELLDALSPVLPKPDANSLEGRAALRCASADYLPLCGPVPDTEAFDTTYANLRRNRKPPIPKTGQYVPGLYMFNSLGSRGLTYAPLCAEYLAGEINGELPALSRTLRKAVNPARFIIRDLARRQR